MEGEEKPKVVQDSSSVTLQSESRPSENVSQVAAAAATTKQHEDSDLSPKTMNAAAEAPSGLRIECEAQKVSLASDEQQSTTSVASAANAPCGLEGSSPLQPAPLAMAVPCSMLPSSTPTINCTVSALTSNATSLGLFPHENNPQKEDTCDGHPALSAAASSCVLPSSTALATDTQQIIPAAGSAIIPALPSACLAVETGFVVSDEGEKHSKKEKIRKRPRQLLQDARACDGKKPSEKQPVIRWKDVWVAQLIHIRGRMHSTFTSPQRQRVDLWQIVKHEMTNSCFGFDKDSEACRKKWIRVYKEYKDDVHLPNDDKSQKCRFYDLLDFYMGNRASGMCSMPTSQDLTPVRANLMQSTKELMVPVPPLANEVDVKVEDDGAMATLESANDHTPKHYSISKKPPLAKRPRVIENVPSLDKPPPLLEAPVIAAAATSKKPHIKSSVQNMLSELVNIGKELLQTTKEFEKEKLAVLHSIKDTLGKIAKKI